MSLAIIPGIGEPELYGVGAAVTAAVVSWVIYAIKIKRRCAEFAAALNQQKAGSEAALAAAQKAAAEQQAEARRVLIETTAKLADVEQRFATHREVADRRQTDASQQISRLEADLAATREIAAQLGPTQSRIVDLERALAAEQGRVQAQEQAFQATNARATDFEKRLAEAQDMVMKHKAEAQEHAAEVKKARDEHAAYLAAGGAEAELAKSRETVQQAEGKIASLQRALKAAETRVEMVQKEFMNAVGVASAPIATSYGPAAASEKKVRDLEEKIVQMEADARKRAREDGYKIAELEYRLSEALEAGRETQPPAAAAAEPEPLPVPAPVAGMPAAPAPGLVEIHPLQAAEEVVPAQPVETPPEAEAAPPQPHEKTAPPAPAVSADKAGADAE